MILVRADGVINVWSNSLRVRSLNRTRKCIGFDV